MSKFCTNCGNPAAPEDKFCQACGKPLRDAVEPAPQTPQTPPPQEKAAAVSAVLTGNKKLLACVLAAVLVGGVAIGLAAGGRQRPDSGPVYEEPNAQDSREELAEHEEAAVPDRTEESTAPEKRPDEPKEDAAGESEQAPAAVTEGVGSGSAAKEPDAPAPDVPVRKDPVQIAPAAQLKTPVYDTTSINSVYLPELGAASNFCFSSKTGEEPLKDSRYVDYGYSPSVGGKPVEEALKEYVDLLLSLPYIEEVVPMQTKSGFTGGSLRYVGTGAVELNGCGAFFGGAACDIDYRVESGENQVSFSFSKGFKMADTGHRLSMGGDYATDKIIGQRAEEAYFFDGETYYNAGDKALSTISGKSTLLINGETYTADAALQTVKTGLSGNLADQLLISGFYRTDYFGIAYETDYLMAGDVLTIDDFIYNSKYDSEGWLTDNSHTFGFGIRKDGELYKPHNYRTNSYDGITVRILQWDASGKDDCVVYFAAEAMLDGTPCKVEGLAAAPLQPQAQQSSSGGSSSGSSTETTYTCSWCGGDGKCSNCGGTGYDYVRGSGGTPIRTGCNDCRGTGECPNYRCDDGRETYR